MPIGELIILLLVPKELDLIVDCATESIHPRDPDRIVTEIE